MTAKAEISGRETLLEAACKLFLEDGYDAVSMQQIAEAAGMTKGAPYYHFRNKDDLFMQVFVLSIERLKSGFASQLEIEGTLDERLKRAMVYIFQTTQGDLSRLFSDFERYLSGSCKADLKMSALDHGNMVSGLIPFFEEAAARGEFSRVTPARAAYLFILLTMGQLQWVRFQQFTPDLVETPESMADELVGVLLNGIR